MNACLNTPIKPLSFVPQDHDTALSAVRNLNGQEVGGRPLRIDLADSDPFLEGKTTIRGEIVDAHETRAQWRERERERRDAEHGGGGGGGHHHRGGGGRHSKDPAAFLSKLPRGVHVPPGSTALDIISVLLGRESPTQILEVLAQMKVCWYICSKCESLGLNLSV